MHHEFITPLQASYPYSKLSTTYNNFKSFIEDKINDYRLHGARPFNRTALAEDLGIDRDTLTKIINGRQRTSKRDLIIVICLNLQLSAAETNQALELYGNEATNPNSRMDLLRDSNDRDQIIIEALDNSYNLEQLQTALEIADQKPLDITRGSREEKETYQNRPLFDELSVEINPFCIAGEDSDRDLHDRYRPERFDFHSEMLIRKKAEDGATYKIVLEEDSKSYEIYLVTENTEQCLYSTDHIIQKVNDVQPCTDQDLLTQVQVLKKHTDRKARDIIKLCADTRNYGARFDAINKHGQLLIYGETFGFDAPELNEYFQVEISSRKCIFSVSNSSRFLEKYIGAEEYQKLYKMNPPAPIKTFRSLKEVANRRWRAHFVKLLKSAKRLLEQIKEEKLFLTNARAWIDDDALIRHYCHKEDLIRTMPDNPTYDSIVNLGYVICPDGKPASIDELYRAAELDIFTLDELCNIRNLFGSFDNFLKIDALEAQKG